MRLAGRSDFRTPRNTQSTETGAPLRIGVPSCIGASSASTQDLNLEVCIVYRSTMPNPGHHRIPPAISLNVQNLLAMNPQIRTTPVATTCATR